MDYKAKPSWWKDNPPTKIQKTNLNDPDESVLPDTAVEAPGQHAVNMGPQKVFKTGYPTGKTVGVAGSMNALEPMQMNRVKPSQILGTHGVVGASDCFSRIATIIHPSHLSLLESLIQQQAFLVTDESKIIDIAAHSWPIDLTQAADARTKLATPVRFGDELGVIASCQGEMVSFSNRRGTQEVSWQDLDVVPCRIVRFANAMQVGDKVMALDGSMMGEVAGESDWPGDSKMLRVRWARTGALADVKPEMIVALF